MLSDDAGRQQYVERLQSTARGEMLLEPDYAADFVRRRDQPKSWAVLHNVRFQAGRLTVHMPPEAAAPASLWLPEIWAPRTEIAVDVQRSALGAALCDVSISNTTYLLSAAPLQFNNYGHLLADGVAPLFQTMRETERHLHGQYDIDEGSLVMLKCKCQGGLPLKPFSKAGGELWSYFCRQFTARKELLFLDDVLNVDVCFSTLVVGADTSMFLGPNFESQASTCLCTCPYTCLYICHTHVDAHDYTHVDAHVDAHAYAHVDAHVDVHAHMPIHMYIHMAIHVCPDACPHACPDARMPVCPDS